MTLSQKMEIYFQDFSFMPLFVQVRRAALVQRGILLTPSRVCPCQENYLKHTFARAQGLVGRERTLKELQLMEQAADSISEGDVMDRMIHGCVAPSLLARTSTRACFLALTLAPPPPLSSCRSPDQQWSLLPNHAVMSAVRPAYFCYGQGAYGQGGYGPSFPA